MDDVPDVTLVNELVRLGDLFHDLEDDLGAVARLLLVETLVHSCCVVGTAGARPCVTCSSSKATLRLLAHECAVREDALLADAMGHEHLEQVVCDLVEFLNLPDMCADNGFLFFEDTNCTIHFYVHELSISGG